MCVIVFFSRKRKQNLVLAMGIKIVDFCPSMENVCVSNRRFVVSCKTDKQRRVDQSVESEKCERDRNVPVDFLEVLSCEVLLFQSRNGKYIFADIRCESNAL